MPPSMKHKCKKIHHLRKLLKIRTKVKVENFQSKLTKENFIQSSKCVYKWRRLLFISRNSSKEWKGKKN